MRDKNDNTIQYNTIQINRNEVRRCHYALSTKSKQAVVECVIEAVAQAANAQRARNHTWTSDSATIYGVAVKCDAPYRWSAEQLKCGHWS